MAVFVTRALLAFGLALPASAVTTFEIARGNAAIVIDGQIAAAEWDGVVPRTLAHEIDPQRGVATNWATSVRVTHDGRQLFVAIDAGDDMPERIVSPRGARDSIGNEDFIAIQVDAEGARQRHYEFRVNPAGVLADRIVGTTGGGSPQWSGTWEAAAKRSDKGYTVELAIPLSTLNARVNGDRKLDLAVNVTRHIGRDRRETVALTPVDTREMCLECQFDTFSLQDVEGDRQALRVRPYLTTRRSSLFPAGAATQSSTSTELGVDLLWQLGNGRKLVGTLNPDFSEIEPDQIQFNVNRRFAVSFNENRPFFTENTTPFGSQLPLVYTRSISDPSAALAYGSEGDRYAMAAVIADDRATSFIRPGADGSTLVAMDMPSHTFLGRLQRNAAEGRRIGLLMTNRFASGYENHVAAIDGRQVFGTKHSVEAIAAFSTASADSDIAAQYGLPEQDDGSAFRIWHAYRQEHAGANTVFVRSSPGFRADAGRFNRVGTLFAHHEWFWNIARSKGSRISNFGYGIWGNHLNVQDSSSKESRAEVWGYMNLANGSGMDGFLNVGQETYGGRTFTLKSGGGGYGWQINEKSRVWLALRRIEQIDVVNIENVRSVGVDSGFNLKPGEKWSVNGSIFVETNRGERTRDFRVSSAFLRGNWSPRLGHTLTLVANWGGTVERQKLVSGPTIRSDNVRAQFVYLYQRKDRSSFHVGINTGGFGDDGPTSVRRTDELIFGKIVVNMDWGG